MKQRQHGHEEEKLKPRSEFYWLHSSMIYDAPVGPIRTAWMLQPSSRWLAAHDCNQGSCNADGATQEIISLLGKPHSEFNASATGRGT